MVVLYARRLFRRVRSVYYNSTVEPTLSDHPKILRFAGCLEEGPGVVPWGKNQLGIFDGWSPRTRMGSESIAHDAKGRMSY